jgi:thiamine biosynthesis lipoprotein
MGVDVGLDLVNQLPGVGCIYVDDKGKIFASKNIDLKKFNNE